MRDFEDGKIKLDAVLPADIEKRSFEIISRELGDRLGDAPEAPVIKRVIHATADFDYADNLVFANGALKVASEAIKAGAPVVTDTNMAKAGVNRKALARHGSEIFCFMADEDVARAAVENKTTRASASMDKAAGLGLEGIYVIGNAPTALIRLYELIQEGRIHPRLVIGVPVGFVNVVQAKELILTAGVPCIVARGRKGGSTVAAAVCNGLLYLEG